MSEHLSSVENIFNANYRIRCRLDILVFSNHLFMPIYDASYPGI